MTDKATIQFPNPSGDKYSMRIFDLQGQVIQIINDIHSNSVVVGKEILPAGYYIFELKGTDIFRGKITVQ
jgi:hypothetical protein